MARTCKSRTREESDDAERRISLSGNAPQGARVLLMDEGCRKCFCVTFDKSNKTAVSGESFLNIAMSGVNKNYVPYLALKQKRGEKIYDETDNQWHDRSRFTGS